jgi:protein-disulfide isomerase
MTTSPRWALFLFVALSFGAACDTFAEKETVSDDDGSSKHRKKKKKKKKKRDEGHFGWKKGDSVAVQLKLAEADAGDLTCASKDELAKGLTCARSSTNGEADDQLDPRKRDDVLQPFTTVDGKRLLIAGVFTQPDVHQQIANSKDRFLASCTLKLVDMAQKVSARTFPKAPWSKADGQWVATAERCSVAPSEKKTAPPPLPSPSPPTAPGSRVCVPTAPYSPRIGPEHAKVTVMFFTDFQCPFCAKVSPTLRQLANKNPKTVAVHIRHFPLTFHSRAEPAARAIQAAQKQGRGWALTDSLYKNSKALSDADIHKYATRIGLDLTKFKSAYGSAAIAQQVKDDLAVVTKAGVRGTPTMYFNGEKYKGSRTVKDFQLVVDNEIKRANAELAKGTPIERVYSELCK